MPTSEELELNSYILETAICHSLVLTKEETNKLKLGIREQKALCPFQIYNRKYKKTLRAFNKYAKHWSSMPNVYCGEDGPRVVKLSRQEYQTYLVSKLDGMETILSRVTRCHQCLACRRDANKGSHRAFLDAFQVSAQLLRTRKLRIVNYVLQAIDLGVTIRPQDIKYPDLPEEKLDWNDATYTLYRHRDFYIDLVIDAIVEYWKEPNPILRNALGLAFEEGIYSDLEDYTGFYSEDDDTDSGIDSDDVPLEGETLDARNL